MKNDLLFKKLYSKIKEAHYILLVTHKNPNTDTISAALSLSNFFYENRIKHKVFNQASKVELPRKLNFLSKFEKIVDEQPKYFDLIVYLNCSSLSLVGYDFDTSIQSVAVDHKVTNTLFADLNIIDERKGSTSELLYSFYTQNNLQISKKNAECLYVGIYDDSMGLTTPMTNKDTFAVLGNLLELKIDISYISDQLLRRDSLARFKLIPKILNTLDLYDEGKLAMIHLENEWLTETGANIAECDDIINQVLSIGIVNIVLYLRVTDNKVKVFLRSKNNINILKSTRLFNDFGDQYSADLTIDTTSISIAKEKLLRAILDYN